MKTERLYWFYVKNYTFEQMTDKFFSSDRLGWPVWRSGSVVHRMNVVTQR